MLERLGLGNPINKTISHVLGIRCRQPTPKPKIYNIFGFNHAVQESDRKK